MEYSTEHFTPENVANRYEIEVNIDRYLFALEFIEGKTVVDLGCGAGLGTYLYSLVAKKVYAVDYDAKAIEEAKRYPFPKDKVEFLHLDLSDKNDISKLPVADVVVAIEILEHLDDPASVLKALPAPNLIFSLPLWSLELSSWHKYKIEGEEDVRNLIEPFYQIGRYEPQEHPKIGGTWMRGEGVKYRT